MISYCTTALFALMVALSSVGAQKSDAAQAIKDLKDDFNKQLKREIDAVRKEMSKKIQGLDNFKNFTKRRFEDTTDRIDGIAKRISEANDKIEKQRKNSKVLFEGYKNTTKDEFNELREEIRKEMGDAIETSSENQKQVVTDLARQTMLQQFSAEERSRSNGDSGVKLIRGRHRGPANYYETGLFGPNFNMMHDHSNYVNTIGLGELCVVMNGVEFMTRHNDYKLTMASTTDKSFHATENIPFPEVPPSVANAGSVDAQAEEMRHYFKAFQKQDKSIRDYTNYFKPVLCYLEGAWTLDTKKLEEPFDSDRHVIEAEDWFELQEKVMYSAYTGTKSRLENFSNLPTTIMAVNATSGQPQYAQWNYRILCHPVKEDLPVSLFKLQDDLAYRTKDGYSHEDVAATRGARYRLEDDNDSKDDLNRKLDRLMAQIPGKDNNNIDLKQVSFGENLYDIRDSSKILNTGYYHRAYQWAPDRPGAQGLHGVARGFNDAHMWVAQTTQDRVAPMGLEICKGKGKGKDKVCETMYTRMSYAIPLEVVYMTPLMSWNPYNLKTVELDTARAGGRNGKAGKPYAGVAEKILWYRTPVTFFSGDKVNKDDPADTVRNAVGVLGPDGEVKHVSASGVKILTQNIEGVGKVRLRYPITPVHGEGSPMWKELNALKDVVKIMQANGGTVPESSNLLFEMSPTTQDPPGEHNHQFSLTLEQYKTVKYEGEAVTVTSSNDMDHSHTLKIRYREERNGWHYWRCDDKPVCGDGHAGAVTPLTPVDDWAMMMSAV